MGKIKAFFRNKWVGFTLASILYILWFVLWTGNWWLLLGEIVIFDLYITRYFYKYVWRHNAEMCKKSKSYKAVYEWVNAIIFATVVASLVHIFFFQMYVIPSSSMEKSLYWGVRLRIRREVSDPYSRIPAYLPSTPHVRFRRNGHYLLVYRRLASLTNGTMMPTTPHSTPPIGHGTQNTFIHASTSLPAIPRKSISNATTVANNMITPQIAPVSLL